MQWIVASSFHVGDGWIFGLIDSPLHRFANVEPHYRHDRSRAKAGLRDWRDYLVHALRAWRRVRAAGPRAGLVTVFPQLAVLAGAVKRLASSRRPLVAMMFNLGRTYGGLQGRLARFGLAAVDRFIVHSTSEIDEYSRWLGLPRERFVFVPLSIDEKPVTIAEDEAAPFVLSMGTAHRDYPLLTRALARLPCRAVIVAGAHALEGVDVPSNVTVLSNRSIDECHALCQRARISVVPLVDTVTAAGQVSVLEAMMFGRPVVATRCAGTVDYVRDGIDGVLVPPDDVEAMRTAIDSLWTDEVRRRAIGSAARQSALARFTFRAVALRLEAILDALARPTAVRDRALPASASR